MRAKIVVYLVVTGIFLLLDVAALMIFTSLMVPALPWHDALETQFSAVPEYTTPLMICVSVAYLFLSRVMLFSAATKILPAAAGIATTAVMYLDGALGPAVQWAGTSICVLAAAASVGLAVSDLRRATRSEGEHEGRRS